MKGLAHCLSKTRDVKDKPGMNTTAGLAGLPVDSAQILVPSAEVTYTAIAEEVRESKVGRETNFMDELSVVDGRSWEPIEKTLPLSPKPPSS